MDNQLERKRRIYNAIIGLIVLLFFAFFRFIQSYLYGACFASWPIYVVFSVLYILFPRFYIIRDSEKKKNLSWGINRTQLLARIIIILTWLCACFIFLNSFKPNYTLLQASDMIYGAGYSNVHYAGFSVRDGESETALVSWMPVFEVTSFDGSTHYISISLNTGNILPQSYLGLV